MQATASFNPYGRRFFLNALHLVWLLPFLMGGALSIPHMRRWTKSLHPASFAVFVPLVLLFILYVYRLPTADTVVHLTLPWIPALDWNVYFAFDAVAQWFSVLIVAFGLLIFVYAWAYMQQSRDEHFRFYALLLLFMGAMLGIVWSDHLLVMVVFWECTSVTSYLLIAFWHRERVAQAGARRALVVTVSGGLALLASALLIYAMTGTFVVSEVLAQAMEISQHALFLPAMILLLIGVWTKSAQVPFHAWLPGAMSAPTPVSAYLHAATMVKAGIYLVVRFTPLFATHEGWAWSLVIGGTVTLFWGAWCAVRQHDLKALLAYSTVSQLGFIYALLGFGAGAWVIDRPSSHVYALAWVMAFYHLLHHALSKGALFLTVGVIDHTVHTRDLRRLHGLFKRMPLPSVLMLLATAALVGLPPLSGYLTKESLFALYDFWAHTPFSAVFSGETQRMVGYVTFGLAILASVGTLGYGGMMVVRIFGSKGATQLPIDGVPSSHAHVRHKIALPLLVAPLVLVVALLGLSVFPQAVVVSWILPMLSVVTASAGIAVDAVMPLHLWHGFTVPFFATVFVFALGAMLIVYRSFVHTQLHAVRRKFRLFVVRIVLAWRRGHAALERLVCTWNQLETATQVAIFLVAFLGVGAWAIVGFYRAGAFSFQLALHTPIVPHEVVVCLTIGLAAAFVAVVRTTFTLVVGLGVVGAMISLLFVLLQAPDLALTQLVIETVSVALLWTALANFAPIPPPVRRMRPRLPWRAIISLLVGAVMTGLTLLLLQARAFESIASYYVENSVPLAHGKNVVNVILVDFRGLDTLLEIVVVAIAAWAIVTLLEQPAGSARIRHPDTPSHDVILRTSTKAMAGLLVFYAMDLLLGGHNEPGGGFVAGLLTAVAFIVVLLTDASWFYRAFAFSFRKVMFGGLVLAIATATVPLLFNFPFLKHAQLVSAFSLYSTLFFDLGVYFTVFGATVASVIALRQEE